MHQPRQRPAIEIFGPWVLNKGDALMLEAVERALHGFAPLCATEPFGLDAFPEGSRTRPLVHTRLGEASSAYSQFDLSTKLGILRNRMVAEVGASPRLARRAGISIRSVGMLVDCSGFAYGDHWSAWRMVKRAEYYARLKDRGIRLVMLPQAVGPFEQPDVRKAAIRFFGLFDRLHPRDAGSRDHLLKLGIDDERIEQVPDLTHALSVGRAGEEFAGRLCVVPNMRMTDKVPDALASRYVDFLVAVLRHGQLRERRPFLLLHEVNDRRLAQTVVERLGRPVEILDPPALEAKAILGTVAAVVASRYHAIVSALSQATPTLGTSWAHKYDLLFEEYDGTDDLISPELSGDTLVRRLDAFLDPAGLERTRARLGERAERQRARVETLWQQLRGELTVP